MPIETLTDARVRGIDHDDGELIDAKSGLLVRADKGGAISFSFRYRTGNTRRRIIVGTYPATSLAQARSAVSRLREQVRLGVDPQQERQARRSAMTFDALADSYIENYAKRQKSSWQSDVGHLRVHARPAWGKRSAASITRQDAAKLLFDVVAKAPVSANRLRSILVKMFGWAADNALLTENPMLGTKKPHREGRGKTRVLRDDEIAVLWRALERRTRPTAAALRVLLLLGQRPGEVMGMAVNELHHLDDPANALWHLPATRTKTRREHLVPLPPLARAIVLAELAGQENPTFVFADRGRLSRHALQQALRAVISALDHASLQSDRPTPHDFRRSCATALARLGVAREDRLGVLGHRHGDVHEIHYDQYDRLAEKRAALTLWEAHVRKVIAL